MKVGIDGNDSEILGIIKEKIIEKSHLVIDLSEITSVNKGDLIYKKVLLANITKINYCILIDIDKSKNIDYISIYYDNCEEGILKSREILGIVSQGVNNIEYTEGNNFYLVQMIESPVIKISISECFKKVFCDNYLELIINKVLQ